MKGMALAIVANRSVQQEKKKAADKTSKRTLDEVVEMNVGRQSCGEVSKWTVMKTIKRNFDQGLLLEQLLRLSELPYPKVLFKSLTSLSLKRSLKLGKMAKQLLIRLSPRHPPFFSIMNVPYVPL